VCRFFSLILNTFNSLKYFIAFLNKSTPLRVTKLLAIFLCSSRELHGVPSKVNFFVSLLYAGAILIMYLPSNCFEDLLYISMLSGNCAKLKSLPSAVSAQSFSF